MNPRRGLALIVVIGILGILAILAAAFVMMAQLERRASEQRVNAARAYLQARSGIEDALARLDLGQDPAYGGEDWNGNGNPAPDPGVEQDAQVYQPSLCNRDDCPVRHALRPSFAVMAAGAPALVRMDERFRGYSGTLAGDYAAPGNGYALKIMSGQGFYINGGDPSVRSNPLLTSDYNATLRQMLGILAEAIDREDGVNDGLPVDESDGWALIDQRPGPSLPISTPSIPLPLGEIPLLTTGQSGWQNFEQVRRLALGGSQAKLDALRPFLTLHAWVDRKVIAPSVASSILNPNGIWIKHESSAYSSQYTYEPAKAYHSWGEYKLDPDRRETKQGLRAPDFERINGKLVGRAPVDLSWVRHKKPALLALLGGLKGLYLDETYATPIDRGDVLGWLQAAEVTLAWDPTDICHKVADQILTSTSEIKTWQQWHDFCDALPDSVVMTAAAPPSLWSKGQAVRDILKANFNPNSDLNKFSPNLSMWKTVDKGDLLVYSTEFSLLPVPYGHQEVSSVGHVLDRRGRLLASRGLKALLAGPPPVRLTTQKEFVSEDLGALDIAGDETGFRLPGRGVPFISQSQGASKTWGHALGQPGLGNQGASLQTYPEPVVNDGVFPAVTLSINPADYDGAIQLATVETAKDDFYTATGTTDLGTTPPGEAPYRKMMMLARYTGNFDLDQSAAFSSGMVSPVSPYYISRRQNHPDFYQVTSDCTGAPGKALLDPYYAVPTYTYQPTRQKDTGPPNLEELRYSLLRAGNPATGDFKLNTLYPDGCYAEQNRVPEYLDKGNADGLHGVMSFWIKAGHRHRGYPILKWTNFASSDTQIFFWGSPLVCFFEICPSVNDSRKEHQFGVSRVLIPHRWELLTLRWDFRAPDANDTMAMLLNAGRQGQDPSERGTEDAYNGIPGNDPTMASDITVDDYSEWVAYGPTGRVRRLQETSPHRLSLGGRGHPELEWRLSDYSGASADATFDEFALYDFGGAGPNGELSVDYAATTQASPEVLASNRYPEGRYYKDSIYKVLGVSDNTAAEWFSAPILLPVRAAHIKGLAWTQIVPKELHQGRISFELVDEVGTDYALGLGVNQLLTNPAFSPVDRVVDQPFRLHAIFQPNLADPINTPILDPLTLDDVTVYYEPLGGPRLLSWSDGEDE